MNENKKKSLKSEVAVLGFIIVLCILIIPNVKAPAVVLDAFNISGGAAFINNTYVYHDHLYVLNNTQLQKYNLYSKSIVDLIDFPLLTSVTEVLRKGSRLYIDAEINGSTRLICVEIEDGETFAVLSNVDKDTTLTEAYWQIVNVRWYGLERIEYYDCNGYEFWTWGFTNSTAMSVGQRGNVHVSIMRGTVETPSINYEMAAISTFMQVGTEYSGNRFMYFFAHNITSGLTTALTWTFAGLADHTSYWHWGEAYFNHTSNTWVKGWADEKDRHNAGGAQYDSAPVEWRRSMNIQFDNEGRFNSSMFYPELYGSAHWEGWRSNDFENLNSYNTNNLHRIWLDTENRLAMIYNWAGSAGSTTIRFARFDTSGVPLGAWNTPTLVDSPNTQFQVHGVAGLIRAQNLSGSYTNYLGYVNDTTLHPAVDLISDIGAAGIRIDQVNSSLVLSAAKVFQASRNLVALYVINGTNNIVVQRNLIPPSELGGGGYAGFGFANATITTASSQGIRDALDGAGWIFEGEVYTLSALVQNVTLARFDLTDGYNNASFVYENASDRMYIETDNTLLAGLIGSSYTHLALDYVRLNFTFILNINIVDILGTNVTVFLNHYIMGNLTGTAITGLNIYNLGGYADYLISGDAGRTSAGDSFEIWAQNSTAGAYAEAGTVWRRLQHTNIIWGLDVESNLCFDHHEQTGAVSFGLQFLENGTWVDSIYGFMSIVDGAVDPVAGVGKAWITAYVSWWGRAANGNMTLQRTSYMSAFPECFDDVNHEVTQVRFHSDVWFNKMNSSTTLGIRLSPMFYGMEETGGILLWGNWNPIMFNESSTMAFVDLRNSTGALIQPHEIELMRFWISVEKINSGAPAGGDCDNHRWAIASPKLSYNRAADRMQAIDTPTGVEPLVPDMPNTSFMAGITKAIQGIGSMIWGGALGFIKILWSSMDTIFQWIGFPAGTMTKIIDFVLMTPEYMIELVGHFTNLLANMASQVTLFFALVTVGIPQMIWGLGLLVNTVISYIREFTSLFTGGWANVANLWGGLNIGAFIELFVVAVFPIMWLERVLSAKDSIGTAREDVSFFFKMIFSIIDLGSWLIRTIATIIGAIRDILPI